MNLNSKLIQRITHDSTKDVMHSSGYAVAQNENTFGAAGAQSFTMRQEIEQQRKFAQGYRNSRIAQGVNWMPKAVTYDELLAKKKQQNKNKQNQDDSSYRPLDQQLPHALEIAQPAALRQPNANRFDATHVKPSAPIARANPTQSRFAAGPSVKPTITPGFYPGRHS